MSNSIYHEGRMSVTDLAALLATPPLPTPAQRAAFASALTAHGGYRLSDPHIQHAAAEACGQEGADALSPEAQTLADLSWRLMRRSGFRIVEADGTIVYYAGHVVRAAAELAALSDDDIMSLVVGAVPQVGEALDSTVRGVAEPEHGLGDPARITPAIGPISAPEAPASRAACSELRAAADTVLRLAFTRNRRAKIVLLIALNVKRGREPQLLNRLRLETGRDGRPVFTPTAPSATVGAGVRHAVHALRMSPAAAARLFSEALLALAACPVFVEMYRSHAGWPEDRRGS